MNKKRDKFLMHFGVLGMKWGKSRGTSSGSTSKSTSKSNSDEHKQKIRLKRKRMSEMTNSELTSFNTRMSLERRFKELEKPKKSSGQKIFEDIVLKSAKVAATAYVTKQMKDFVTDVL